MTARSLAWSADELVGSLAAAEDDDDEEAKENTSAERAASGRTSTGADAETATHLSESRGYA
jgi:hypothetical protein